MKLLTIREAAEELRLSANTVYALCQAKKLRHERHGLGRGKILVPIDALEEYRRSVTVRAAGEATPPSPRPTRVKLQHLRLPS